MSLALAAALSQSIVPRVDLPPPQEDPCAGFEEAEDLSGSGQRAFTLDDQVRMADIGRANPLGAAKHFSKLEFCIYRCFSGLDFLIQS